MMRNLLRKIIPIALLNTYRKRVKRRRNRILEANRKEGRIISKQDIIHDLSKAGINADETLLVHSSLSKIGYIDGGAKTVVEALLELLGENGNLLMPTSPNSGLQLEYIESLDVFDVARDKSKLGAISEYFRSLPEAIRSAHPTEPVSCIGPDAAYFTEDHFGTLTPYTADSPFFRVSERGGKILYLGVTLDNAGTNLHTMEDAVEEFRYPVYFQKIFEVSVRFPNGEIKKMNTKVHNPEQSVLRKCDDLLPLFKERGVYNEVQIGEARALLFDAKRMLSCMIEEYEKNGVTMYTPDGA